MFITNGAHILKSLFPIWSVCAGFFYVLAFCAMVWILCVCVCAVENVNAIQIDNLFI